MTILDKNGISVEEHVDDLFRDSNIEVLDWQGSFDNLKAVAFKVDNEKYVAFRTCLEEDERVVAKMHEYAHHELDLFYSLKSSVRERERVEARVKRKMVELFLKPEYLCEIIERENTFNPRALAEVTHFSADIIEYAEHLYFELKGITPPNIEDTYLQ